PSSDYYKKADFSEVRNQYKEHIARLTRLAGIASEVTATTVASQILDFETKLAEGALPPDQIQDPTLIYHPTRMGDVQKMSPSFSWNAYFQGVNGKLPKVIDITEPGFLRTVDELVQKSDLAVLRGYLKWQFLETVARYSSLDMYQEWF